MSQSRVMMTAGLVVALVTPPSMAVKTAMWTHEQPKDFVSGELDNVVVSSLGEVMLGRSTRTLYESPTDTEIINALARAGDGKVYAATGPGGVIHQIDGQKVTVFATLPEGGTIFSLLFTRDGKLLAGTGGGAQATIYLVDGTGKASVFHQPAGAKYIWAMTRGREGEIYAATGIEGKLHKIAPDGSHGEVVADLKPKNLLCLAIGRDGMLYTGTDEDGLVYRIDPTDGKAFVMYDATQPEISAIVLDAEGNVYASTADANAARPGRVAADKPGGKPEQRSPQPEAQKAKATEPVSAPTGGSGAGSHKPDAAGKTDSSAGQAKAAAGPSTGPASQPSHAGAPAAAGSQPAGGNAQAARRAVLPGATDDKNQEKEDQKATAQPAPMVIRQVGRPATGVGKEAGNVIYRIDTDGFVTEVFREPVMILSMAEAGGTLYVATGNEGRIYALTPAEERTTMLAKLPASQATTLLRLPEGRLVVGTANAARLVEIADALANKGTLVSAPLDAEQMVKWGRLRWSASVPTGTKLTIATRSSNVQDPESDAWDEWSAETDATSPQQIASVSARFLRYRLTFETTVRDATPTLRRLEIARIEENRAPQIESLEVASAVEEARKPGSPPKVKAAAGMAAFGETEPLPEYNWVIKWKAEDPNKDPLIFDVFFRDYGGTRWIRLVEDAEEPLYIWDTRTVSDGKYEVRVVAKDSRGNPPGTELTIARVSDALVVDNTAPDVTIERLEQKGADALLVEASLTDAASRIGGAAYCVDSHDKWIPLAPDDDIFDSATEAVSFTVERLQPGEHRLALRAQDERGNTRYATRLVRIGN